MTATAVSETTGAPTPAQVGVAETLKAYRDKVRGGDIGSLPAVLGLIALVLFFSIERPHNFPTAYNFGNLITQGAAVMVLSMGLIFVLLLGEIDLSAGFTAGTSAAVMAVAHDQPRLAVVGRHPGVPDHRSRDRPDHRHHRHPDRHPVLRGDPGRLPGPRAVSSWPSSARAARSSSPARSSSNIDNANLPIWLGWTLFLVVVVGYAGLNYVPHPQSPPDRSGHPQP